MAEKQEGRVAISVARGGEHEDANVFIGINGVNYLLPKGKRSEVPAEVAEEFERAERARDALDEARGALRGGV